MPVQAYQSLKSAKRKVLIDASKLEKFVKGNAKQSTIRHKATNYDELWRTFSIQGFKGDELNMLVHKLQNYVNDKIYRLSKEILNDCNDTLVKELKAKLALVEAELVIAKGEKALQQVKEVYHCPEEYVFHGEFKW